MSAKLIALTLDLCAIHRNIGLVRRALHYFAGAVESHQRCLRIANDLGDCSTTPSAALPWVTLASPTTPAAPRTATQPSAGTRRLGAALRSPSSGHPGQVPFPRSVRSCSPSLQVHAPYCKRSACESRPAFMQFLSIN